MRVRPSPPAPNNCIEVIALARRAGPSMQFALKGLVAEPVVKGHCAAVGSGCGTKVCMKRSSLALLAAGLCLLAGIYLFAFQPAGGYHLLKKIPLGGGLVLVGRYLPLRVSARGRLP